MAQTQAHPADAAVAMRVLIDGIRRQPKAMARLVREIATRHDEWALSILIQGAASAVEQTSPGQARQFRQALREERRVQGDRLPVFHLEAAGNF